MNRRAAPLLTLVALAGCAPALEGRVASRLEAAGFPHRTSQCMAKRWVDRLSIGQLRKIQSLTTELARREGALTIGELIGRVDEMHDPEILRVVTSSAAHCALKF